MNTLIKIIIPLLIISYWLPSQMNAQTAPQAIITWQVYNYYPSDYPGKALATPSSRILVSAEVIENNRFLDLSPAVITWFVDGKFINSGLGLKEIPVSITKVAGETYLIGVSIKFGDKTIESVKRIPINTPEIIINNPFPNNVVPAGQNLFFEAIPYFFNIKSLDDLTFSWKVNNEEVSQFSGNQILVNFDPTQINVSNELNLNVFVQNRSNSLELKSSSLKLRTINQ